MQRTSRSTAWPMKRSTACWHSHGLVQGQFSTMRHVILDTETTGLEVSQGHRIIEIGCVEMLHRRTTDRTFHRFVNPGREIDEAALEIHGITQEFLADKPVFPKIADELLEFIRDAELVIHNAAFDIEFINAELSLAGHEVTEIRECCSVTDTLELARKMHPGQKNSLDALCKRYEISNPVRELHGALLDAQILAEVYLAMTGGQSALSLGADSEQRARQELAARQARKSRTAFRVIEAREDELAAHEAFLDKIAKESDSGCVWRKDTGQ